MPSDGLPNLFATLQPGVFFSKHKSHPVTNLLRLFQWLPTARGIKTRSLTRSCTASPLWGLRVGVGPILAEWSAPPPSTAFPGSFRSVLIFRCQLAWSVHFHDCLLGSASHPPYLACSVACFFSVSIPSPWKYLSHFVIRHPSVPLQVSFPSPAPPPPQLLERESYLLFTAFPESLALCLAPGRSFVSFHWLTEDCRNWAFPQKNLNSVGDESVNQAWG